MNQESRNAGKTLRNRELTDRIISAATNLEDGLILNFATAPLTIKRFCRELPDQNELHDVAL
jgi:hypothetical protein